jgi:hypothetical protein
MQRLPNFLEVISDPNQRRFGGRFENVPERFETVVHVTNRLSNTEEYTLLT